ncbi:MAG: enoyl-CoA hydratase/isomerase family protein [Deltaproteobacteria bacterium]|nr:enoyl-CoA hydratase/isomerase family protein [Deltaproteobacteria bacterium]
MGNKPVLYAKKNKTGIISFNRPDNLNTMNQETVLGFKEIIDQVKEDRQLRCLIITGSGTTFCGGADLKSGFEKNHGPFLSQALMDFYTPFLEIRKIKAPVIAAINGHAIGGGFGIAIMCDIRVINSEAKLGANFARLGLHPGMAISYILPRLVGLAIANELLFTGRIITGKKAASMGLVNYAVDKDKVMEKSMEIANEIAGSAPVAVRMMKHSIYRGLDWDPVKAAEIEAMNQARTFEMEDAKEGMCALLEKRKPDFQGC